MAEFFQGERGRQCAGVPDFQPVRKEHDLDAGVAGVVAVGDGVDDGFADNFRRNFIFDRSLGGEGTSADGEVDFGQDKVHGLIHQFESSAFVDLMRRDGLAKDGAVEVGTLHLGRQQKPLRGGAEEQDGGMGGQAVFEKIQVLHDLRGVGFFREGKRAGATRDADEALDLVGRQIRHGGIQTGGSIPRATADELLGGQVIHEAGIERGDKFGDIAKAAADELRPSLPDERGHLRLAESIIGTFDKNKALFSSGRGSVELALCGGEAGGIRRAVVVAEDADIDGAAIHFGEINIVGVAVGGGQVFEKKDFKKAAQEHIALDEELHGPPFGSQFLLDAGEEEADGGGHWLPPARASNALRS